MAGTAKYNPDYHVDWAWSLYIRGSTDAEVAEAFGVSKRTIIRWSQDHPEFAEIRNSSKSVADAKVERSLFKRATGYDYQTSETTVSVDDYGQPKPAVVKTYKHHAPPDPVAIIYWLKNRRPDEWRDKRDDGDTERMEFNAKEVLVKIKQVANGTRTDTEAN